MTPFRFFLTARHWQLFLLFIGVMFLAQFVGIGSMPSNVDSPQQIQEAVLPFFAMTFLT